MAAAAGFTFGIEEEYFVVNASTRAATRKLPKAFLRACLQALGERFSTELLQSQAEICTSVFDHPSQAREELPSIRREVIQAARSCGLEVFAAGTHPLAHWSEQEATRSRRYGLIMDDLQMLGWRNLVCGLHVHVALPDTSRRVELMSRAIPFLPLFLALSTSSPFWQGRRTGLLGYRLAAYDELPRTGLPPIFRDEPEYQWFIHTLVDSGVIKDSSYVWWALRPSAAYPTLELRVMDSCTRVEDSLALASLFRCLIRHLYLHPELNANLNPAVRFIADENRWRAQRYGLDGTFVDHERRQAVPMREIVRELLGKLADDARALECEHELTHVLRILELGTSADAQIGTYQQAREAGDDRANALRKVIDQMVAHTAGEPAPTSPVPPPGPMP
jgi:carboxylate-amine ligase